LDESTLLYGLPSGICMPVGVQMPVPAYLDQLWSGGSQPHWAKVTVQFSVTPQSLLGFTTMNPTAFSMLM
jgi:hypothetical protein